MYVTTHGVKNAEGEEAVHGFLHVHGVLVWPADVCSWPEDNPGRLRQRRTTLRLGGNAVRSYLDVLAPDGTDAERIVQALSKLRDDLRERVNPTVWRDGVVTVRFGVEFALERERIHVFDHLVHVLGEMITGR
jgi:hypothetical protein